jgi:hypothetical protein
MKKIDLEIILININREFQKHKKIYQKNKNNLLRKKQSKKYLKTQ